MGSLFGSGAPFGALADGLARALSEPGQVVRALGEPRKSQVEKLYADGSLVILNVVWAPWMTVMPHNHEMWAVIGIYTGREDNVFWRRTAGAEGGRIEAAGARALCEKDVTALGRDIIHSVTNPIPRFTGAIHVYGGDFVNTPRSQWDPDTLLEQPWDFEFFKQQFAKANAEWAAQVSDLLGRTIPPPVERPARDTPECPPCHPG